MLVEVSYLVSLGVKSDEERRFGAQVASNGRQYGYFGSGRDVRDHVSSADGTVEQLPFLMLPPQLQKRQVGMYVDGTGMVRFSSLQQSFIDVHRYNLMTTRS
jgi:hypothetical protein